MYVSNIIRFKKQQEFKNSGTLRVFVVLLCGFVYL